MRAHFIAIGGSAMHNLAIALKLNGYEVTGSDDEIFEPSRSRLEHYDLLPKQEGWFPDKITDEIDAIILGMHAKPDNPELIRAQESGLKIYSYPEFLYQHSQKKARLVVGGSHGKTTITGMVMHVMQDCGLDFDYLVGSKLKDFDVMVRLSDSAPVMVFEGDEYLSSPIDRRPKFHWYKPNIALLSGIAWDHINVFPTMQNYLEQFEKFIDLIQLGGTLIYCENDEVLVQLVKKSTHRINKLGYKMPGYTIRNGVTYLLADKKEIPLKIFGGHNLLNLEGARHLCEALGISKEQFYRSIAGFDGTANRLELLKESSESRFYKDFAHAPSKVRATIKSVREQFPQHKLVCCLELHTYSSLNKSFLGEYFASFDGVDSGAVYYNDHALKLKRLPPLEPEMVKKAFGSENLAIFADSEKLIKWLFENQKEKTIFLMMSSGNFGGIDMQKLANKLL